MKLWRVCRVFGVEIGGEESGGRFVAPVSTNVTVPRDMSHKHAVLGAFFKNELMKWGADHPMVALINARPGLKPDIRKLGLFL